MGSKCRLVETGHVSQQEAASFCGLTVQGFKKWTVKWGVEPADKVGTEVLYLGSEIVRGLRDDQRASDVAEFAKTAPVFGEGGDLIDTEQERKLKLRAERIGQEIKNSVALSDLAPIDLMESALGDIIVTVNKWLESVPGAIKRVWPEVPGVVLDLIERECAETRNSIADGRIEYSDARLAEFSRDSEHSGSPVS